MLDNDDDILKKGAKTLACSISGFNQMFIHNQGFLDESIFWNLNKQIMLW